MLPAQQKISGHAVFLAGSIRCRPGQFRKRDRKPPAARIAQAALQKEPSRQRSSGQAYTSSAAAVGSVLTFDICARVVDAMPNHSIPPRRCSQRVAVAALAQHARFVFLQETP
jgi:hypothetical protein